MTPPKNWQGPLSLRPAFTPQSRTPWGGKRIAEHYGEELGLPVGESVGEAWVLSLDPQFPSRVGDELLSSRVDGTLLVKLLDAAQPLSVQIHPSDDYAGLGPRECGKPEAWYVVDHAPGAGLFLGFREGVGAEQVRTALAAGADVSKLMHFVPVAPGDFFVIDAGTPHAVGAGVMVVEPQRVIAGASGITYRYWDWGRRYDANGAPSEGGKARELHVDHAIAVTDWERVTKGGFVDTVRCRAGVPSLIGPAAILELARGSASGASALGPGSLRSGDLRVARVAGTGACTLPDWGWGIVGLTVLEGSVHFLSGHSLRRGETAALPHTAGVDVVLEGAHALLMAARPA